MINKNHFVLLTSHCHTLCICHISKQRITRWLTSIESPSVLPWHWAMSLHRAPSCADGSPASGRELTKLSSGDRSHWGVRGGMTHPWNGTSSAGDRLLSSVEGESDREGALIKRQHNTTQAMMMIFASLTCCESQCIISKVLVICIRLVHLWVKAKLTIKTCKNVWRCQPANQSKLPCAP